MPKVSLNCLSTLKLTNSSKARYLSGLFSQNARGQDITTEFWQLLNSIIVTSSTIDIFFEITNFSKILSKFTFFSNILSKFDNIFEIFRKKVSISKVFSKRL